MTDNEIIQTLEKCSKVELVCDVKDCPYEHLDSCACKLDEDVLDLIKRQQTEIEMLNKEVDRLSQCVLYHDGQITDAIKDFAEKHKNMMKRHLWKDHDDILMTYEEYVLNTDNIAKECVAKI